MKSVKVTPEQEQAMRAIKQYMLIMRPNPIGTEQFAKRCNMCLSTFKTCFKHVHGETAFSMYQRVCMESVAKLLLAGHTPKSVRMVTGYKTDFNFNKIFKRYYHMSAAKYYKMYNT
jgi:AraC-like DNA-binding protein